MCVSNHTGMTDLPSHFDSKASSCMMFQTWFSIYTRSYWHFKHVKLKAEKHTTTQHWLIFRVFLSWPRKFNAAMVQLLFDGLPTEVLSGWPFILQPGIPSVKPYGAQRPAPPSSRGWLSTLRDGEVTTLGQNGGTQKMGTQTGRSRDNFLGWRQSFSRDGWSPWWSHLYSKSMYTFVSIYYIHI